MVVLVVEETGCGLSSYSFYMVGEVMVSLARGVDSDSSSKELLMQAIQGNGSALNSLASQLNCDINSVRDAVSNV
jgi:hypothetical protein